VEKVLEDFLFKHDVTAIVCGGRAFSDWFYVSRILDDIHRTVRFKHIVQGGARGADFLAKRWAFAHEVKCTQHDANWKLFGASAGSLRNAEMLNSHPIDLVVAFPGGAGTKNMMTQAAKRGIVVLDLSKQYTPQSTLQL
jgi:hypothetical protein